MISMEWWKVIILGIVEGLTEFLPISSTGHLLLVSKWLNFQHSDNGTFEIFIQLGAVLAVLGYYGRDLLTQAAALPTSRQVQKFWLNVIVAFVPAAAIGFLLHDWITTVFYESPTLIASSLLVGGLVLIGVEKRTAWSSTTTELTKVSWWQALITGLSQVVALLPGVSRSGATMVGGMLMGMDRETATKFSFYLAIPTLASATLYTLLKSYDQLAPGDMVYLLVGMVVSMITAWLSIGWLLRYVARNTLVLFGVYRIIIGLIILLLFR